MTDMDDDFRSLMRRVRGGSEEAAWELVEEYGDAIRRAVRRALHVKLRPQFDSLDFVQIVWKSFFRARDEVERFDRPQDLAAFLIGVARNKVRIEARRLTLEKYDVRREQIGDGAHGSDLAKVPDRQPPPMEVAIAREQWERMLEGQPDHYRRLIEMRLQGHTFDEIGAAFHLTRGAVCRILKRLLGETPA